MMDSFFSLERFFGRLAASGDRQEQVTNALGEPEFIHEGKWPLLFLLFGLLLAFVLVRVNTRLIRSGVKWWPGNIEHGDLHIHHVVFGFTAMVIAGIVEFAVQPTGWTQYIVAFIFGGAMGIALDEFALILHVKDVYWQEAGRQSVDAVVIAIVFICMFLVGLAPLSISNDAVTTSRWTLFGYIAVHSVFVVITLLKGKMWSGIIGIFIPIFAWVGACRLARPNSPWAHSRYEDKPRKMERARRRAETNDRRYGRLRLKLFDFIGGKPSVPTAADPPHGAPAAVAEDAAAGSDSGKVSGADAPAGQRFNDWDWRDYD
jgi:lysyl-tRNA synthetase class 2